MQHYLQHREGEEFIVLMSKLKTPTEHQQLHQDTDLSHAAQRWCSAAGGLGNMQLVAGLGVSRQLAARYSLRSADNRTWA